MTSVSVESAASTAPGTATANTARLPEIPRQNRITPSAISDRSRLASQH
jgi:hypothetical protein